MQNYISLVVKISSQNDLCTTFQMLLLFFLNDSCTLMNFINFLYFNNFWWSKNAKLSNLVFIVNKDCEHK